jgi:hypothetical protein
MRLGPHLQALSLGGGFAPLPSSASLGPRALDSGPDALSAKRADDGRDAIDGEVDVGIGGRAAQAESDGGAGAIANGANGLQYV